MATQFAQNSAVPNGHIVALDCGVDRSLSEPLAQQLYRQLRDTLLAGRLPAGSRLPSTRDLARQVGVSRTVTLAAYDQLIAEGYLDSRRGSGAWVRAALGPRELRPSQPCKEATTREPLRHRLFDPAAQPVELFDRAQWARLLGRGWRNEGAEASLGHQWRGLASLREALAQHLRMFRGIDCGPDEIFITSGHADALQVIGRAVSRQRPGASAWIEDPGYGVAREALIREGLTISAIPVDEDGLCVARGREADPGAALALVTPSRQFPLGMPLSLERRLELVRWSRETGALLVEDDYDCELRFCGRPIPSLITLDPGADVLSIGSLSKLTFAGLRLGYVVGPRRWIDRLAEVRAGQGAAVATSAQPALAEYVRAGLLSRHLRALRLHVGRRRDALIAMLAERLGGELDVLPQQVGMHLTVVLNGARRDVAIARDGADLGLHLQPLSAQYVEAEPRNGFMLGYSAWNEDELARGVETLRALLAPR